MAPKEEQQETHYQVLLVDPSASQNEIKQAYKKAAMKWHPDKQRSEQEREVAKHQFQNVAEAYSVLSDSQKRKEYDNQLKYGHAPRFEFSSNINADALFNMFFRDASVFGTRSRGNYSTAVHRVRTQVTIALEDSIIGIEKNTSIPFGDGHTGNIVVPFPPGVEHGQILRVTFERQLASNEPSNWIVDITVLVKQHILFKTTGRYDLVVQQQVPIYDALSGFDVEIASIDDQGRIDQEQYHLNRFTNMVQHFVIPNRGRTISWSKEGEVIQLQRGNLIVEFTVQLPSTEIKWTADDLQLLQELLTGTYKQKRVKMNEGSAYSDTTVAEKNDVKYQSTERNTRQETAQSTGNTQPKQQQINIEQSWWNKLVNWFTGSRQPNYVKSKL